MTQLQIQEALWWLDEALVLLSFIVGMYGISLNLRSKYCGDAFMIAGLIGVWAIYSLLWSV